MAQSANGAINSLESILIDNEDPLSVKKFFDKLDAYVDVLTNDPEFEDYVVPPAVLTVIRELADGAEEGDPLLDLLHAANSEPTLIAPVSGSVTEGNGTAQIDDGLSGNLVGGDADNDALIYGIQDGLVDPQNSQNVIKAGVYGTLTVNTVTGAYVYTKDVAAIEALNAGDTPEDSFTVTVSDGDAVTTAEYIVQLNGANDSPVAATVDLGAIDEDNARVISAAELLAGVSDVDGPAATITSLTKTAGLGTLVANPDGTSWTYTPALNDDTEVTFDYTASDGQFSASSTASLDITPVNDSSTVDLPRGATFGGTASDYTIVNPVDGALPTSDFTVSFFVNDAIIDNPPHFDTYISYALSGPGSDNELTIWSQDGGGPLFIIVNGSIASPAISTGITIPTDGNWHHIALTFNAASGAFEVFLDGVSSFTGVTTAGALGPGGALVLGQEQDSLGGGFDPNQSLNGSLADVAFFDGELSSTQIADIAAGTVTPTDANIFLRWNDATQAFEDISGGGNNDMTTFGDVTTTTGPVPVAQEDTSIVISGIEISDVDDGSDPIDVTLSVDNGDLAFTGATAGLTVTDADGSDGTLAFSGSQSDLNAALANSIQYTPDLDFNGADTLTVTADDGGGSGVGTLDLTIPITPVNDDPTITSDGGGETASVSISENTTAVTTVVVTDPEGDALTYAISGGADSDKFEIINGNELVFKTAPDFENPTDLPGTTVIDFEQPEWHTDPQPSAGHNHIIDGFDLDFFSTAYVVPNTDTGGTALRIDGDGNGFRIGAVGATSGQTFEMDTLESFDLLEGEVRLRGFVSTPESFFSETIGVFSASQGPLTVDLTSLPNNTYTFFDFQSDNGAIVDNLVFAADSDNVYDVEVTVDDGNGGTDTQAIAVTVTNDPSDDVNIVYLNDKIDEDPDTAGIQYTATDGRPDIFVYDFSTADTSLDSYVIRNVDLTEDTLIFINAEYPLGIVEVEESKTIHGYYDIEELPDGSQGYYAIEDIGNFAVLVNISGISSADTITLFNQANHSIEPDLDYPDDTTEPTTLDPQFAHVYEGDPFANGLLG